MLAAERLLCRPAAQPAQAADVAAPLALPYRPTPQAVHPDDPVATALYAPAAQLAHVLLPTPAAYEPAGQAVHTAAAAAAATLP